MQEPFKLITTAVGDFAAGAVLAQGYKGVSLAFEQSRLNEEWGKNRDACRQILSRTAIEKIKADERSGLHAAKANATEPPFMAPSVDPTMYSKVSPNPHASHSSADSPIVVLYLQGLRISPNSMRWMQSRCLLQDFDDDSRLLGMGSAGRKRFFHLPLPILHGREAAAFHGRFAHSRVLL